MGRRKVEGQRLGDSADLRAGRALIRGPSQGNTRACKQPHARGNLRAHRRERRGSSETSLGWENLRTNSLISQLENQATTVRAGGFSTPEKIKSISKHVWAKAIWNKRPLLTPLCRGLSNPPYSPFPVPVILCAYSDF